MSNPKWWIGSNSQTNINLIEISVITLLKHLEGATEQNKEILEFGLIENLSRIFIEGADHIRNSKKQDPKYRADMLRIFELIESNLENLKTNEGIDLRICQFSTCDTCSE